MPYRNDEELNKLLAGVTIAQGGVLPNIQAEGKGQFAKEMVELGAVMFRRGEDGSGGFSLQFIHLSCLDRVTGGGRFGEFGLTIQASRRKALEIAAVEPELWPEVGSSCEEICKDVEGAKEEEEKFNKHEEKAKKS